MRRINPDWIYISGWGVMNQVAVKEAAAHGIKMDHVVGNWWTGTEADVVPAGDGAKGYKSMTFHAPGANFKVHQDIFKHVYDKGKGAYGQDRARSARCSTTACSSTPCSTPRPSARRWASSATSRPPASRCAGATRT